MADVPSNGDPFNGIPFTSAEVTEAIQGIQRQILGSPNPTDAEFALLVAALGLLPKVSAAEHQTTTGEKQPEEDAIVIEATVSGIATAALAHLVETRASTAGLIKEKLKPLTLQPKKAARERADQAAQLEAKRQRIAEQTATIQAREQVYAPNARQLREFKYQTDGETKNGTWLEQKITEMTDNGSQNRQFTTDEARFLAGLSTGELTHEYILELKKQLGILAQLRTELQTFGGGNPPRGLFSAVQTLHELHEGQPNKFRTDDLKPLADLARLLFADEDELLEHYVNTLQEGPFADCEVLPVVPFQPEKSAWDDGTSTVEVPNEMLTEENILDDITKAVKASGGEYVIEQARITDFILLHDKLIDKYGAENIKIFRTLRPKWHPLPWYVIQVAQSTKPPLAVLEIPVSGNASYYINNGDWLGTIEFGRMEARTELDAKAEIHTYGPDGKPQHHVDKLYNRVVKGHKG